MMEMPQKLVVLQHLRLNLLRQATGTCDRFIYFMHYVWKILLSKERVAEWLKATD
jgi:hypothetical protein